MKKILLVDDDEAIRSMLKIVLERAGFEVYSAENGEEALKSYRQHPIDLILTDLVMPNKEGLETIVQIRKSDSAVKIIAMSGGGRGNKQVYLAPAKALGANAVIAKPFTKAEIMATIESVLQ